MPLRRYLKPLSSDEKVRPSRINRWISGGDGNGWGIQRAAIEFYQNAKEQSPIENRDRHQRVQFKLPFLPDPDSKQPCNAINRLGTQDKPPHGGQEMSLILRNPFLVHETQLERLSPCRWPKDSGSADFNSQMPGTQKMSKPNEGLRKGLAWQSAQQALYGLPFKSSRQGSQVLGVLKSPHLRKFLQDVFLQALRTFLKASTCLPASPQVSMIKPSPLDNVSQDASGSVDPDSTVHRVVDLASIAPGACFDVARMRLIRRQRRERGHLMSGFRTYAK
ncbi:hypothetical protein C8R45DRAFT_923550 [Mycena sanguinolenta]|nr:hypothetical protein C8R45DRAFT_923550 [Mycena sanguinolenta]